MAYEEIGVEIDPNVLAQQGFDMMAAAFPGWEPVEGAPETMLIEIGARFAADAGYLLTTWAETLFRFFGESLHNIAQSEATAATALSTWTAKDNTGYTIEAGTEVQLQNAAGEWVALAVVDEVIIPAASTATTAGEVELQAVESGESGNGLSGAAESIEALSWLDSIALVGSSSGGAEAEDDEVYLGRLRRRLQLMAPRPIKPDDFAVLALDVTGIYRATAIDNYNPEHNLLSANAASVETDVTDWSATTNCAIAQSATQAKSGSQSLRLRSTAGGDMVADHDTGVSGTPVTAYQQYTFSVYSRAGATGRDVRIGVNWYTGAGAAIGATVWGTVAANDATDFDNAASVTAVAPATAEFAALVIKVVATAAANEDHYFDQMQVRTGSLSTPWVAGGTPDTGNEATVCVPVMASDGTAPSAPTIAEVKAYLEGLREEGFAVYVVGPDANAIDVDYDVKLLADVDEVEVLAAIDAALTEYLQSQSWGVPPSGESDLWVFTDKLRRGEVYTIINNVGGVDYVDALTINTVTDEAIQLYGVAPVTDVGALTGSAV